MKIRRIFILAIPAALLIWATAALPYTLEHSNGFYVRWPGSTAITMNYNLVFPAPSAAMQPSMVQAVIHHVLIDEWNAVLGSSPTFPHFVDGGTTTVSQLACDGVNVITFTDDVTVFPAGVLAFTSYSSVQSAGTIPPNSGCGPKAITATFAGQIIDADITFNPAYAVSPVGLNSIPNTSVSATIPTDLEGTLLHEAGHVLGLHHSGIISARMVAFGDQFYGVRSLTTDDIAGINAAYGTNVAGGSVAGKVVDQNGNPVVDAHVVLTDATSGLTTVSALTQTDGTYQIVGFPASTYNAYVEPLDGPNYISYIPLDLQDGASYVSNGAANFTTSFYGSTLNVVAGTPVTGINFKVTNPESGNLLELGVGQTLQGGTTLESGTHVSALRGLSTTMVWVGTSLAGDGTVSVPSQYMSPTGSTIVENSSELARDYTLSATTPVGWYNLYSGAGSASAGSPPSLALSGALLITNNPVVGAGAIVDGAAFGHSPGASQIAPGSIISIFGTDLAANLVLNYDFPVPTQLGGVQVKIGNQFAPLFFVSSGQINAMVPYEVSGSSSVDVQVISGPNSIFDCGKIAVSPSAPRVFVNGAQTGTGGGVGAIQNGSQNYVTVTSAVPASAGDVLVIYMEGLGVTTPATVTGLGGINGTVPTVTVTIGGKSAAVAYAGVSPGFAGLYQVNASVPAGLGTQNATLVVTDSLGNQSNIVTVAVH